MRHALLAVTFALAACSAGGGRGNNGGNGNGGNGGGAGCVEGTGCTGPGGDVGLCCGGSCIDITSDANNCGGCGSPCPQGTTCNGGLCVAQNCVGAAVTLGCLESDGQSIGNCCNGECLDPSDFNADPQNCGYCGTGCAASAFCQNGNCALADGGSGYCASDSDCGSGQSCTSLGSCNTASCTGAGQGENCTLADTDTDGTGICCPSGCVDYNWDSANCGGCDLACPSGSQCLYGYCYPTVTCGASTPEATCLFAAGVEGACCGSTCVNYESDPQNCGGCAAACPTGSQCFGGSCYLADGGAAYCTPPSSGCPSGTLCGNGLCEPASCTGSNAYCFLGIDDYAGLCCNGNCVDATADPANCGTCGTSCAGSVCVSPGYSNSQSAGLCLPPAASTSCNDVGGCPGGEQCVDGVCLETDCTTLETYLCATPTGTAGACCEDLTVGVFCADLATDPGNCGSCGTQCPNGQSCVRGVCSGSSGDCGAGHVNDGCSISSGPYGVCCPGGGCSDPTSDVNNCGFCGNPCASGQSCVQGNCQ